MAIPAEPAIGSNFADEVKWHGLRYPDQVLDRPSNYERLDPETANPLR